MMAGAIALYEEALREAAAAPSLRTADGRALPLQMSRRCGRPMPPTRNCSNIVAVRSWTWAAALGG